MSLPSVPVSPDHAAPEEEVVTATRVACDGGALGHPRVWLQIDPTIGWIDCGYCGKRYLLARGAAAQ